MNRIRAAITSVTPDMLSRVWQELEYHSDIRILRRIFGTKRNTKGVWRRFDNEELYSLYRLPNIIRVIKSRRVRWAGHVGRMGEDRSAFKFLAGTPRGKGPLARPRHRWEDNIRIDLKEIVQ